ncbi:zinc-ribbon domain-containing protein [Wolbachia endosymbiont of Ctenocephalides felis wCfeT]|uniref:zinc-ribbon domain-containing protein n=1 Tax=Wolbachia endosymbiont of Ctenocephalides felis wCfeT TaxID=2732593 RepID=UPI001448141D|nr:zinc-ribbon domain-containing protein [Wolbachia endosymbiont of Ctenocephalides felis wCfeT]
MKIQCNNCAKIYLISPGQIGESGKKVKCTNCNNTWYEYPRKAENSHKVEEKKTNNKSFVQSVVFTTLVFTVITGLCVIIANDFFPREINKMYRTIGAYKDSIGYKLGYRKEKTDNQNVKKLAANKFYQDYLFLSKLKSS